MLLDDVPRETVERLARYVDLLLDENTRQNLIASSTIEDLWRRHIDDSVQLECLGQPGAWLDVGSGAGLPGMVLAIVDPSRPVHLVEPRSRRADFLCHAAAVLDLPHVVVHATRVETISPLAVANITARAVAILPDLLSMALPHATAATIWLLPKGRKAAEEVAAARRTWQGRFDLVPSLTDPEASIVVARDVQRRTKR